MNYKITEITSEADKKMNGFAMIFYYRCLNICVNSEPASLLSTTVNGQNIEDIAKVAKPDDKSLIVFPLEDSSLFSLAKSIKLEHPEFNIEEEVIDCEPIEELGIGDKKVYLRCIMPEIDTDRYENYKTLLETLYSSAKAKIKLVNEKCEFQITRLITSTPIEDIENGRKELQKYFDNYIQLCDKFNNKKIEEIEKAYKEYLSKQTVNSQQQSEMNLKTGFKIE